MSREMPIRVVMLMLLGSCVASAQVQNRPKQNKDSQYPPLPFPEKFDPARYLGKWHEAARLPTPMQPKGTLATAEYSKGEAAGEIVVKNTLYDGNGKEISMVQGNGQLLPGDPPRMIVGFGPVRPTKPNYFVVHVDENYQYAIVGNPERKLLHILVREVPVDEDTLDGLTAIATKAGFDTNKLVINRWETLATSESDR